MKSNSEIVVIIVLMCGLYIRSQLPSQQAQDKLNGGLRLIQKNKYEQAEKLFETSLKCYRRLCKDSPSEYRKGLMGTLSAYGMLLKWTCRKEKSEALLREAITICEMQYTKDPERNRNLLSKLTFELGEMIVNTREDGEKFLLRTQTVCSGIRDKKCVQMLAKAYEARAYHAFDIKKNYKIAMQLIDFAIETAPDMLRHYACKAEMLYLMGEESAARELWDEIQQKDSTFHWSRTEDLFLDDCAIRYNTLAYISLRQLDYDAAIAYVDSAIAIEPENPDWYDSMGEILFCKGEKQEAHKMWEKVLELNPQYANNQTDFYWMIHYDKDED